MLRISVCRWGEMRLREGGRKDGGEEGIKDEGKE